METLTNKSLISNPLVSVIVPCYNQGKFIRDSLESVRLQTFTNFECIIVNDGSTDDSLSTIQEYCEKDNRFRYINKVNEGVCISRNIAIQKSSGKYILPLDADDRISPLYLETTVKILEEDPCIKLVYTNTRLFGNINREYMLPKYNYELLLCRNIIVCTALFRRKDFYKTGGYNPNMSSGLEDWDFWLSLLNENDKVHKVDKDLFFYRIKNISRNVSTKEDITKLRKQIWNNHRQIYAEHFIDPRESIEYAMIKESWEYKLGSLLLKPIRTIMKLSH